ncbi:MAG: D-alanine--D-alanine ligase [Planctomycetes bacterium]|nr:D-alanine--D-alanine ligase [Planctomycetota bacterium]
MSLRIAIMHDRVPEDAAPDAADTLVQRACVESALAALGHEAFAVQCSLDLEQVRRQIVAEPPDCVFNLVESLGGRDSLLPLAPLLLDALGVPYTGSPALALVLTTNKLLAKKRMLELGLPTPPWVVAASGGAGGGASATPSGTYLLKAVGEHASKGIDDQAVVEVEAGSDLAGCIREHARRLGAPCFAEKFVAGREFSVALLERAGGVQVLPASEIDFSAFPAEKPQIVGYRAKWNPESEEYARTPRRLDFPPADRALLAALGERALACWHAFGLAGYARVDFRVDAEGSPWILEVNANPCLAPDAGYCAALQKARIPFETAIAEILAAALAPARGR